MFTLGQVWILDSTALKFTRSTAVVLCEEEIGALEEADTVDHEDNSDNDHWLPL